MKFANATNLNRKSGGAKPSGSAVRHSCAPLLPAHNLHQSQHQIRGERSRPVPACPARPLLETRNDNGEVGFPRMIGGGCGPVGAGHTNGAPQIRSASLGGCDFFGAPCGINGFVAWMRM